MFNKRAHVITTEAFAEIAKQYPNADRFHLVDPCDGRMWFMCWVLCPRPDKWIIYREFPSHGHKAAYIEGVGMPGPWALNGEALDGVKGPGQDSKGFSLERYKEEIEKRDAGENIRARYIDSRYATSPRIISTSVTNLQEQLLEVGIEFLTMVPGKGRIIGGENNDGSIDMINSALFYDAEAEVGKFSAKLGRLNEPQLQVVETCPNTIDALEYWTGEDGQKGSRKDPIDVIRGMFLSGINFVGEDQFRWVGGRWSGSENRDRQPYLAMIPVNRYIDPEDINWGGIGNSYVRALDKYKSRSSNRLAGPAFVHSQRPP